MRPWSQRWATQLALVEKFAVGRQSSIAQLSRGSRLTLQAITKHLRVLEWAGLMRSCGAGRENLFELHRRTSEGIKNYVHGVSAQWSQTLARLKTFLEK
jgi:hypothetical protein